jgi:uncharacterized membrane protein YbhN (UPF0104 family)
LLKSIKSKTLSFWIKSLIFLVAASVLYFVLSKNEKLNENYLIKIQEGWQKHSFLLLTAILLIPLNWSLEAYKWKFLIGKLERINFTQALEGVIVGVTMGFVTPHSIGDYAARIFFLTNSEREKGIGAVFISRISQFYITLYFGTVSLVFYVYNVIQVQSNNLSYNSVIWFTVFNNIVFIFIFIYHQNILRYFETKQFFKKLIPYFEIIKTYSFREINFVMLLSLLRYTVFCVQFILVLMYFDIELSLWLMLIGVTFVFFIKSVIPTFLDLGVRETAAVFFFGVFSTNHQNIILASLTLWMLNIVFPTILGLFLVYKIRLFNKEKY